MREAGIVSQKCKYALRAIFELVLRDSQEPVKVQEISNSQGIPQRFLEVILSELKQGGFVFSTRGNGGGYNLARPAKNITVGEIIQFFHGKPEAKARTFKQENNRMGDYVFAELWKKVSKSISDIYNKTTFEELAKRELSQKSKHILNYSI